MSSLGAAAPFLDRRGAAGDWPVSHSSAFRVSRQALASDPAGPSPKAPRVGNVRNLPAWPDTASI
jgi:hypothetical protein